LTPLNYFDSDIPLDLANAILLHPPSKPRESWGFDDYGVNKGHTCIPETPPPFKYFDLKVYGANG
ncbi:hypothetical protein BDP27DRAFT_1236418, partial [Rhodocollybia butyracea]